MALPTWGESIDTVVVLGAGASKSYRPNGDTKKSEHDFPLDTEFFEQALDLIDNESSGYGELRAFLEYFYPCNVGSYTPENKSPGLEAVYTLIETFQRWLDFAKANQTEPDLEKKVCAFLPPVPYVPLTPVLNQELNPINRNRFTNAYLEYDVSTLAKHQAQIAEALIPGGLKGRELIDSYESLQISLETIRRQLDSLVYTVFSRCHATREKDGTCAPCELHTELFQSLITDGSTEPGGIRTLAVLSFNYDLVADSSLAEAIKNTSAKKTEKESERKWTWNAETFYMQLFDPTTSLYKRPEEPTNTDVFLLKLHGSLNWFFPNGDRTRFVCGETSGTGPRILSEEELCRRRLDPMIVPLVLDKFVELEKEGAAGHHGRTWTLALDSLLKAKRWIFIGYSLPATDFHANWLFRMAASYRRSEGSKKTIGSPPKIEIINPDQNTNLKQVLIQNGFRGELKEYCCLDSYLNREPR